jgi:6-phosphogluconolactonase
MPILIRRCSQIVLLLGALLAAGVNRNPSDKHFLLYVGTYTDKESKGIYAYRFDPDSSKLSPVDPGTKSLVAETTNPSYLAIDPRGRFLYAVNENHTYKGVGSGGVSAFAIHRDKDGRANGKLMLVSEVASRGTDPCFIAFDKSGKFALVANYSSGSVAVFPIKADGSLGDASAFIRHAGSSVDKDRQAGPHAHWIETTPDNRFAIAVDLGLDELLVYRFNAKTGSLLPNNPPYTKVDAGNGPRHLAFHPNRKFAYVINELQSSVTMFTFDAGKGKLRKRVTISTLPRGYSGANSAAEIKVHPNGKFLFASNRGHDSIAVFSIDENGSLTLVENVATQGKSPREFEIDPSGKFLLAANQESDNIVAFRIDESTGRLTPTGQVLHVPAPVCLKFVPEE